MREKREFDGVRRVREHDKKRIARRFDLLALAETAENFPNRGMVPLDRRHRLLVSKLLLEFRRADNIGEHQRQDRHSMAALELLNLIAALDRDLL